jgi:hypothetical protein
MFQSFFIKTNWGHQPVFIPSKFKANALSQEVPGHQYRELKHYSYVFD